VTVIPKENRPIQMDQVMYEALFSVGLGEEDALNGIQA